MRNIVTILVIITLGLLSCSRKSICYSDIYSNSRTKLDSRILKLERIGIGDTTLALIRGNIIGRDSSSAGIVIDTLPFANVYVINNTTGKKYGNVTDSKGFYQFSLPSSTYDLRVSYVSQTQLIIRDVFFGIGDIFEFDAELDMSGPGPDSTVFQMQADRTIIQLNQSTKRIKK